MKSDGCEDIMKAMEKEIKYLTTEDVWGILTKSSLPTSAHIIQLIRSFKKMEIILLRSFCCRNAWFCKVNGSVIRVAIYHIHVVHGCFKG